MHHEARHKCAYMDVDFGILSCQLGSEGAHLQQGCRQFEEFRVFWNHGGYRMSVVLMCLVVRILVEIPHNECSKMDVKSYCGVMVGCDKDSVGYKIYNLATCRIVNTVHLRLNESTPGFSNSPRQAFPLTFSLNLRITLMGTAMAMADVMAMLLLRIMSTYTAEFLSMSPVDALSELAISLRGFVTTFR